MYLLVAHATLASCGCPFAQARCHARVVAAASYAWLYLGLDLHLLVLRFA